MCETIYVYLSYRCEGQPVSVRRARAIFDAVHLATSLHDAPHKKQSGHDRRVSTSAHGEHELTLAQQTKADRQTLGRHSDYRRKGARHHVHAHDEAYAERVSYFLGLSRRSF